MEEDHLTTNGHSHWGVIIFSSSSVNPPAKISRRSSRKSLPLKEVSIKVASTVPATVTFGKLEGVALIDVVEIVRTSPMSVATAGAGLKVRMKTVIVTAMVIR